MPEAVFKEIPPDDPRLEGLKSGGDTFKEIPPGDPRLKGLVGVETAPLQAPAPREVLDPFSLDFPEPVNPVILKAANAGVIFDRPIEKGAFLSSLGFDDAERLKAFEISNPGVQFRIGEQTGQIEFLDEESGRFSLAQPPGERSVERFGGTAIQMFPEITIAGITAAATKSPVLTELGAGIGAGVGEVLRLEFGRQMGINQKLTDGQIVRSALVEAGIAAGSGMALDAGTRFFKLILDASQGKIAPSEVLDALELKSSDARIIQDAINDMIQENKLRFSVAQATGDENLLAMQSLFERDPAFREIFGEFEESQRAATREFFDTVNAPYESRLTSSGDVGRQVQGVAESQIRRQRQIADQQVGQQRARLDDSIAGLNHRGLHSLGPTLREVGTAEQTAFKKWADKAIVDLNRAAGNAQIINNNRIFQAVQQLDTEITDALFPALQQPQRRIIGSPGEVAEEIPENIRFLRESITGDPQAAELTTITSRIFDPNAKFTFAEAWAALKGVKRLVRLSSKGLSTDDPSVGALKFLQSAIERDLFDGARTKGPLGEMYTDFVTKYRGEKRRLDSGIVGEIMTREGGPSGRFVINNEQVFADVFANASETEADEILALIGDNPEAMQAMRETIVDFYRNGLPGQPGALDGGRVNVGRHDRFFDRYERQLRKFFTSSEIRDMKKPGGIERGLRAREQARSNLLKKLDTTFEGKLANLDPRQITGFLFDNTDPARAELAVDLLINAGTPDILRAVRSDFIRRMSDRVAGEFRGTERILSPIKLNDFLEGKGGNGTNAAVVRNLFGPEYLNNLRTLRDAIAITSRETRHPNRSNTAFWENTLKNVTRAYLGLFTRPGRFLTAAAAIRQRAANRVFVNALLNPDDMRRLIETRGLDLRSKKAAAIIGALGGTALLEDSGIE